MTRRRREGERCAAKPAHEAGADHDPAGGLSDDHCRGLSDQFRQPVLSEPILYPDGRRVQQGHGVCPGPGHRPGGGERWQPGHQRDPGGQNGSLGRGRQKPEFLHFGWCDGGDPGQLRRQRQPDAGASHAQPAHRPERKTGGERERPDRQLHGPGPAHLPGGTGLHRVYPGPAGGGAGTQQPALSADHRGPGLWAGDLHSAVLPALPGHGHAHPRPDQRRQAGGGRGLRP